MKKYLSDIFKVFKRCDLLIECLIYSFLIVFIDVFNLITFLLNKNCLYLMIIFLLFFLVKLVNKKNLEKLYSKNVNVFDKYAVIMFCMVNVISIYVIFFDYKVYKLVLLFAAFFLDTCIFFARTGSLCIEKKKDKSSVYDLRYICNNVVELAENEVFLLEEKDVDYDLLNRKNVINQLYNTIVNCMPKTNFTIGLNGPWGSGKTTIINNVLRLISDNKKLDKFEIIRFDPWKFDDEKSILKGLLSEILNKMNFDLTANNFDALFSELIDSIFDSKDFSIGKFLYKEIINSQSKIKIETIVNGYLEANDKRLLLIIDNFDRVDVHKALFLLRCIETITSFNRSIYVLSYDENILDTVLKEIFHSPNSYMEKIVQLRIDVPETDYDTLNRLKEKATNNIFMNGEPFVSFVNDVKHEFNNIRELKRFINSILSSNVQFSKVLNRKDESNLEYIKATNLKLYYEIWNHKNYFISYDRQYDSSIYTMDIDGLNKSAKLYFDKLFENDENLKYKEMLMIMFPSVENYFKKYELFNTYLSHEEYRKSIVENRISNTRYFDLYFTGEENDFTRLNNDVDKVIVLVNKEDNFFLEAEEIVSKYNPDELRVFFEIFQLHLEKINIDKISTLIILLLKLHSYSDNRPYFFQTNATSRINMIIADLLAKISNKEFNKIYRVIKSDYRNLSNYSNIKYWIEHNVNNQKSYEFNFEKIYNELCQSIIDNNINLFSKKNYMRRNIWSLYQWDKEKTKEYVMKNISSTNIYMFLSDLISISVGTRGYGYSISKSTINSISPDLDIDYLLVEFKGKLSEKDKFIKSVYDFYKQEDKGLDDSIYMKDYIDINY